MNRAALLVLVVLASCAPAPETEELSTARESLTPSAGAANWIDLHVHLWSHRQIDAYVDFQNRFGMQRMALQSPPRLVSALDGSRPNLDAEAILAKVKYPDRFYWFAGVDLTVLLTQGEDAFSWDLEAQVDAAADAGADGLKLYMKHTVVEGVREVTPGHFAFVPDNPKLARYFAAAARRHLPVLIHLDEQYFDNGVAALKLYPNVTWLVTHLAWAQTRTARLDALLAASPRTYVDVGHFVHLGELVAAGPRARTWLEANAGRVFQSSDFGSGCELQGLSEDQCPNDMLAIDQVKKLRGMLETNATITFQRVYAPGGPLTVTGLALSEPALKQLYHDNAERLLGSPRPIACPAARERILRLRSHTRSTEDRARLDDLLAQFDAQCR